MTPLCSGPFTCAFPPPLSVLEEPPRTDSAARADSSGGAVARKLRDVCGSYTYKTFLEDRQLNPIPIASDVSCLFAAARVSSGIKPPNGARRQWVAINKLRKAVADVMDSNSHGNLCHALMSRGEFKPSEVEEAVARLRELQAMPHPPSSDPGASYWGSHIHLPAIAVILRRPVVVVQRPVDEGKQHLAVSLVCHRR